MADEAAPAGADAARSAERAEAVPAPSGATPIRTIFTVARAADVCGVSPSTVRRRLNQGVMPNAWKDARGAWKIPVTDLAAAGLEPGRPAPPPVDPPTDGRAADDPVDDVATLRRELDETRRQIADLRHRRELAERLAAERERHIEDLRAALRQLGPGDPPVPNDPPGPTSSTPTPDAPDDPDVDFEQAPSRRATDAIPHQTDDRATDTIPDQTDDRATDAMPDQTGDRATDAMPWLFDPEPPEPSPNAPSDTGERRQRRRRRWWKRHRRAYY